MEVKGILNPIFIFGIIYLGSHILRSTGEKLNLPFVTILIILGYIIGPEMLDILENPSNTTEELISNFALGLIGLIIGSRIKIQFADFLRLLISCVYYLFTNIIIIFLICYFILHLNYVTAAIVALLISFTAPTHIFSLLEETKNNEKFKNDLMSLVTTIELILLIAFPLIITKSPIELSFDYILVLLKTTGLLVLFICLGFICGYTLLLVAKRTKDDSILMSEVVGVILIATGLSLWLEFIPIITTIIVGAILRYKLQVNDKPSQFAKDIEWLSLIPFFILAGVKIDLIALSNVTIITLGLVVASVLARFLGALWFHKMDGYSMRQVFISATCLMPIGGVSIGMTLYTIRVIPSESHIILSLILGLFAISELFALPITRTVLKNAKITDSGEQS